MLSTLLFIFDCMLKKKYLVIPLKVILSYCVITFMVIFAVYVLKKENSILYSNEKEFELQQQKLIGLSRIISSIYSLDNIGRRVLLSNDTEELSRYKIKNDSLLVSIDKFRKILTKEDLKVSLDSLSTNLNSRYDNIVELKKIQRNDIDQSFYKNVRGSILGVNQRLGNLRFEDFVKETHNLSPQKREEVEGNVDLINQIIKDRYREEISDEQYAGVFQDINRFLNEYNLEKNKYQTNLNIREGVLLGEDIILSSKIGDLVSYFEQDMRETVHNNSISFSKGQQKIIGTLNQMAIIAILLAVIFLLLISYDFIKIQRYREQLEYEQNRSQQITKTREMLVATVSHDLKTPLNTIEGYTELLEKSELDQKQYNHVRQVRNAAGYIQGLIQGLLDYSRIESGTMELKESVFRLDLMLQDVAEGVKYTYPTKEISLIYNIYPIRGKTYKTDALKLRQVISNLIGNAYKFTESGFVKIKAFTYEKYIEIIVSDSGIGIEESQVDNIFDEFKQANPSIERKYGGAGLGLTISRKIVELLKGNIQIKTELGKGSMFIVTLPLTEYKSLEVNQSNRHALPKANESTIVVLDDHESMASLTTNFLERLDFEVFTFNKPRSALDFLEANQDGVDLVITDIQMPLMDGFEFLKQLKSNEGKTNIPVIAMSGRLDISQDIYLENGFSFMINKPFTSDVLYDVLENYFQFEKINKSINTLRLNDDNLSNKKYSLDSLRLFLQDDTDQIKEILRIFIEDTNSNLLLLKEAIRMGDQQSVKAITHRMLSMNKQIDAEEIVFYLHQLESFFPRSQPMDIFNILEEKCIELTDLIEKDPIFL